MNLFNRYYWLLLPAICFAVNARAQTAFSINGIVYSKGTNLRVANVAITNSRSKTIGYTNDIGLFAARVAVGDTLEFTKGNYAIARQIVSGLGDIVVVLLPATQLKEVIIKGQTQKQQLDEVVDIYRSKGLYFDGRPPWYVFSPISGSPFTGFYELFGRDARNERRFIKYAKAEQAATQDATKYNKRIVKQITGLPDDELQKFMDAYTPSHADLQQWNDYEVITYIKRSMGSYMKAVK